MDRDESGAGRPGRPVQLIAFRHVLSGTLGDAVPELERLAADGDLRAIRLLAAAYPRGDGIPVDHDRAAVWLASAAGLGDERAARGLAACQAYREEHPEAAARADG